MKLLRYLIPALLLIPTTANAIIIRSGVSDSRYFAPANALPALADLPMEGHGTLIAKRWVVTAAHAVQMMRTMPQYGYVIIAGKRRTVSPILLYPGYLGSRVKWDQVFKNMNSEDVATWMSQYEAVRAATHESPSLNSPSPSKMSSRWNSIEAMTRLDA